MRESKIESYMLKQAKKYNCLFCKFISPANNGVPDRIILHPSFTKPTFIELKRPGEKPRPLQKAVHAKMKKYGADIYIIDSMENVDTFFQQKFGQKRSDTP